MGTPAETNDYDLTDRGYYYLDYLIHWDEYILAFGNSEHHRAGQSRETINGIKASLLDECVNLLKATSDVYGAGVYGFQEFKVNKVHFLEWYRSRARVLLGHLDKTDKRKAVTIDEEHLEKYLAVSMNLVVSHNLANSRAFCFRADRIIRSANEASIPLGYRYVYDIDELHVWVLDHVELLKGETT